MINIMAHLRNEPFGIYGSLGTSWRVLRSLFVIYKYWQLYKPLTPQSGQSSEAQYEVEKGIASSGATSYAQQLIKKLKGPDEGRKIINTELQKYLNEGLEEDEVGDDVLG